MFTKEGIQFVAAHLLTTMTFPEIAAAMPLEICSFKRLVRTTPELTPYKLKHYEIVQCARRKTERKATCLNCKATYTQYRSQYIPAGRIVGEWPSRRWCDQCVAEQTRKKVTPEERRRKDRERYQKNKETEQQWYREYYARNREKEIEKTRRNKAIKKYGLDPEHWKEQWLAMQADPKYWAEERLALEAAAEDSRKEQQWINVGRKLLAKTRKHLNPKAWASPPKASTPACSSPGS